MRRFSECFVKLLLVFSAALFIVTFRAPEAGADSFRLYESSVSEYMLSADPGEDPHLKIEPVVKEYYLVQYEGSSGQLVTSSDGRALLHDEVSGDGVITRRHSRVNLNFWMIRQMIFWTLTR